MPAPKNPNTAAATAAVIRRGQQTLARKLLAGPGGDEVMAAALRGAGWRCTPPKPVAAQRNPGKP
jgi:hypothetical protein